MKLSVEGKVAAAVAAGFVALTAGVIAQGNNAGRADQPNGYGAISNAAVNTHTSARYYISPAGRTDGEENKKRP